MDDAASPIRRSIADIVVRGGASEWCGGSFFGFGRYVKMEKMKFRMGQERTPANGENVAERYGVEVRGFAPFIPIAASTLAARVRRGRVLVVGLIVLLCPASLGFMDPGVIVKEVVGQYRWRMAMGPTVLPVEQEKAQAAKSGSDFKECANGCPVMIVLPAGKFIMGSRENESDVDASERLQHEVTIAKPFAVSKFEVTFEEWDACVAAAACPQVPDSWGRGEMPVINVSWGGAKQYVGWLSQLTGKDYRLLTEAEWEYASRASTITRYSWGDDSGKGNANCDDCGSQWDLQQTAPVGSFKPNAFGLYDMHGNIWEWVEDSWHPSYYGAPTDGSAWLRGGDPSYRVVRGGSWRNETQDVRAAARRGRNVNVQFDTLGFRVARTIKP
jgi:formylglycine-generating enzyme required for sulfatase activity